MKDREKLKIIPSSKKWRLTKFNEWNAPFYFAVKPRSSINCPSVVFTSSLALIRVSMSLYSLTRNRISASPISTIWSIMLPSFLSALRKFRMRSLAAFLSSVRDSAFKFSSFAILAKSLSMSSMKPFIPTRPPACSPVDLPVGFSGFPLGLTDAGLSLGSGSDDGPVAGSGEVPAGNDAARPTNNTKGVRRTSLEAMFSDNSQQQSPDAVSPQLQSFTYLFSYQIKCSCRTL